MTAGPRPVSIYLSYAQKDEELKQDFEDYLIIMQQSRLISGWTERQVQRGTDWSQIIDPRLLIADLVLLFVSPSLLASGYCSGAEVRAAFERSQKGKTRVIPIILRYVNLKGSPFEVIQSLPRNAIPVSVWPDRNVAWSLIDQDIRQVIQSYYVRY